MNKTKEVSKKKQIILKRRFVVRKLVGKISSYNVYNGIDLQTKEQITAYIKLYKVADGKNGFCKRKLDLYAELPYTPKFLSSGDERINGIIYQAEIFEKLGPSLEEILKFGQCTLEGHNPHLVIYNIIILLEKLHETGVVYRNLSTSKLFLSKNAYETELYFAEFIESYRKGDAAGFSAQKHSSIGSHLGLPTTPKDDWESLSYIIMDIFTQGTYFQLSKNITPIKAEKAYFALKNEINPLELKTVPAEYMNFFMYIRNLSPDQEPAIEYWKKQFKASFLVGKLKLPYSWVPRRKVVNDEVAQPNIVMDDHLDQDQSSEDMFESCRQILQQEESLTDKFSKINFIESKQNFKSN